MNMESATINLVQCCDCVHFKRFDGPSFKGTCMVKIPYFVPVVAHGGLATVYGESQHDCGAYERRPGIESVPGNCRHCSRDSQCGFVDKEEARRQRAFGQCCQSWKSSTPDTPKESTIGNQKFGVSFDAMTIHCPSCSGHSFEVSETNSCTTMERRGEARMVLICQNTSCRRLQFTVKMACGGKNECAIVSVAKRASDNYPRIGDNT